MALLVLALVSGCAWTLMQPAPAGDPASADEPPRCTETEGWAIWDTAIGTSTILVGGLQLAVAHETESPGLARALGVANLAAGGVFLASALLGYHRADDCARARDDYFAPQRP